MATRVTQLGLYNLIRFVKFMKLHVYVHFIDFFTD